MEEKGIFDKEIIAEKLNKDGNSVVLRRKLENDEIAPGYYRNDGRYYVYINGIQVGMISVAVANHKAGDTAEMEYVIGEEFRNKGTIGIAVKEVLKDVFVDESYDGFPIRPNGNLSNIQTVFLAINESNHASQAVARKNSFSQDEKNKSLHRITKRDFLELLELPDYKEEPDEGR